MKLSTRTRYGVRLMLELALNYGKGYTLLKDVARHEEISEKYLSLIIIPLKSAGLVTATRGARGGYMLARAPKDISLKELFDVLEGEPCLVDCVKDAAICPRAKTCVAHDLWFLVNDQLSQSLAAISLDDLVERHGVKTAKHCAYDI